MIKRHLFCFILSEAHDMVISCWHLALFLASLFKYLHSSGELERTESERDSYTRHTRLYRNPYLFLFFFPMNESKRWPINNNEWTHLVVWSLWIELSNIVLRECVLYHTLLTIFVFFPSLIHDHSATCVMSTERNLHNNDSRGFTSHANAQAYVDSGQLNNGDVTWEIQSSRIVSIETRFRDMSKRVECDRWVIRNSMSSI